jgi:hypothetical protein
MKRSDFFKSIFGAAAIVALPNQLQAVESEKEYSFDELFHRPYNNEILFYPNPETIIYKKIKESIGENRFLECKHFHYYLGVNDVVIPKKEKYTISDFEPFILCLKSHYKKNHSFAETEQKSFFRMIDEKNGTMFFDLFVGGLGSQYGS